MVDSLLAAAILAVGLALVVVGGVLLRRGLTGLALKAGWAPLGIGLTSVAWGACVPQLAVAIRASFRGGDLAVGMLVGSVVFQVLVILGLAALLTPLLLSARWIRGTVPCLVLAALVLVGISWDGHWSRSEGGILLAALGLWWLGALWQSRREAEPVRQQFAQLVEAERPQGLRDVVLAVVGSLVGLGVLALGAHATVEGVSRVAVTAGYRILLIGLSVVAISTVLPELIRALRAARRGQPDVAAGLALGGGLTTLLGVGGVAALLDPHGLMLATETLRVDLTLLLTVAILGVPLVLRGTQVRRWEGLFFVGGYAAYLGSLILRAVQPGWIGSYLQLVGWVTIPVAVILVMLGALKAVRRQRPARPVRHRIRGI